MASLSTLVSSDQRMLAVLAVTVCQLRPLIQLSLLAAELILAAVVADHTTLLEAPMLAALGCWPHAGMAVVLMMVLVQMAAYVLMTMPSK